MLTSFSDRSRTSRIYTIIGIALGLVELIIILFFGEGISGFLSKKQAKTTYKNDSLKRKMSL